jgi:sialic acid synthase SpsE
MTNSIFHELFVLELANNHLGKLERGLRIIREHSQVVRFNNARATIKLQLRDVDSFVHKDFRARADIRYVKKTLDTRLSKEALGEMAHAVRVGGCLVSATPFDEASVDLCAKLNLDLIKLASSDINDWFLIEKIATLHKPVIASTGGSSLRDIDDLVKFFGNRGIPFAINHCVAIYPSEDAELELNQIDFLRARYRDLVIGFSTHEYTDWRSSIMLAYAKGARTFERHIDVEEEGVPVSPYCSLPHQIDTWIKACKKAKEMCGGSRIERRFIPPKERKYLDALVRGVYARRDLPVGHVIQHATLLEDFYLAIPLQKGQMSCRELMTGEVLVQPLKQDEPLRIDHIDSPYARDPALRQAIYDRGL